MRRLVAIYILLAVIIMVGYGLLTLWLEQYVADLAPYRHQTRFFGVLLGIMLILTGALFYLNRLRALAWLAQDLTTDLRRAEQRYRELFEGINDAILVYDETGRILDVNDVACRRLGYPREELLQMHMDAIRESAAEQPLEDTLTRLMTEKRLNFECVHRRRDGRRMLIDTNAAVIRFRGKAAVLAVCRDVTERKQVEEALHDYDLKLRAVVERTDDSIFIKDRAGRYLLANPASASFFEHAVETLLNRRDEEVLDPEHLGQARAIDQRVMEEGRSYTYQRRKIIDGTEHVFLVTKFPYRGPEGEVLGVVGVCRDVTADKLAEDFLLQLNNDLAQRNQVLHDLYEMGMEVTAQLEMIRLPRWILERACKLLNADGGTILLYDEVLNALRVVDGVGIGASHVGQTVRPGEGIGGRVFQNQQAMVVQDYAAWEGRSPRYSGDSFNSFLSVPLRWLDKTLGVLNLVTGIEGRTFNHDDIWLAELFTQQAAVAVENARLLEAERRQREVAETLHDIGTVLTSALHREDVLEGVLAQVARVLPYDAASVWLKGDDGLYHTVVYVGYEQFGVAEKAARLAWSPDETPTFRRIHTQQQTLIVPDVTAYPDWIPIDGFEWLKSWAGAPIVARGEVIGIFAVDHTQPGFYGPQHEPILAALATQISIAVGNALLYEAELRQREIAEILQDIGTVLTGALSQEDVLKQVLAQVARVLPYDAAGVWLSDEGGAYRLVAEVGYARFGLAERARQLAWTPDSAAPLRHMHATNGVVIIPDVLANPDWKQVEGYEWLRSWAGAPIVVRGKVLGMFALDHTQPHFYGPRHEPVLQVLATQISVAVESARLFEQVQDHASTLQAEVEARTAEIRQQQERTEAILRNIGDMVVIADLDGKIVDVNDAFQRFLGWERAEVVGRHTSSLTFAPMPEHMSEPHIQAMRDKRPWRGELFLRHRDGQPVEVETTTVPFSVGNGEITGFIASMRNISAERALERMKSQFMNLVSHELRTPLTNIKLRLHLLRRATEPLPDSDIYIAPLEEQVEQLTQLMEKVLWATRLADDRPLKGTQVFNVRTLLENIRVRFGTEAANKAITLTVFPPPDDTPVLLADEEWVTQACYELIENALTYTPGGGHVTVELRLAEQQGGRVLVFAVQDNGPGISAEDLTELNAPFIRLGEQRAGVTAGIGVGLFIARTVAEQHGGRLVVESALGVGSTFALWLPITD